MTSRRVQVLLHMLGVVAAVGLGFVMLQRPARQLEARAAARLLQVGGSSRIAAASDSTIEVFPARHAPFRAVVTPTCSSLASVLVIAALATVTPRPRRRWGRVTATAAAVTTVVAGNITRITASLAVGLVAGRTSLILFHDWVGSVFGFAYTLAGYVLLVYLLLPSDPSPDTNPCLPLSSSLQPAPASLSS